MFFRASTLLLPVVALSSLAAAAPNAVARGSSGSSCGNGNTMQCCNQTYTTTSTNINYLEGLLGIVLSGNLGSLLGLNCSPITVLGVGSGTSCTQQTVCCDNVTFNGLINIGCINISL